jgi:hypothetical protein
VTDQKEHQEEIWKQIYPLYTLGVVNLENTVTHISVMFIITFYITCNSKLWKVWFGTLYYHKL